MDNLEVDNKYKEVLSTLSVAKNQKQNIEKRYTRTHRYRTKDS